MLETSLSTYTSTTSQRKVSLCVPTFILCINLGKRLASRCNSNNCSVPNPVEMPTEDEYLGIGSMYLCDIKLELSDFNIGQNKEEAQSKDLP